MKRVLAVIDGSNFYHGSKWLCPEVHLANYRYRELVETMADQKKIRIIYCVGEIKKQAGDKKSEILYSQQQSLFYSLGKQKIDVFKGFMLKSDGRYHEKGVDVQIAVEVLKGALKNEYDECLLFTSDTDIIPAILEAKKAGKKIMYVGFESRLSRAMIRNCTKTLTIKAKMIRKLA